MAGFTPLKGRSDVKKPSDGNSDVRFVDRTEKVAGIISGGVLPSASRGIKKGGGCKSCGR